MDKISLKKILLFILAFFIMLLPRRLYIGMYSSRIFILMIFFLALVVKHKNIKISNFFTKPPVLLYLLYIIFHFLFEFLITSTIGFVLDLIVLFYVTYTLIDNKKDFIFFLKSIILSTCIYSVLCCIETFTEFNIFDLISGVSLDRTIGANSYRYGLARSYGAFTTSINNGAFFALMSIINLALFLYSKKKIYLISHLFILLGVFSTISRSPIFFAFISNLLMLCYDGFFKFIKKHFLKIFFVGFVLGLVLLISEPFLNTMTLVLNMFISIFNEDVAESITNVGFGTNADGMGERFLLYKWVWEAVEGNEFFGMGWKSEFSVTYRTEYGDLRTKTSIENEYLRILYNFGLIGMVLFILFVIYFIYSCFKKYKSAKNKIDKLFYFMFLVVFITYPLILLTVSSFDEQRLYYIAIALYFSYNEKNKLSEGLKKIKY